MGFFNVPGDCKSRKAFRAHDGTKDGTKVCFFHSVNKFKNIKIINILSATHINRSC